MSKDVCYSISDTITVADITYAPNEWQMLVGDEINVFSSCNDCVTCVLQEFMS